MSFRALIVVGVLAAPASASPWEAAYAFGGGVETIAGDAYGGVLLQIGLSREIVPRVSAAGALELVGQSDDGIEGAAVRALGGVEITLVQGGALFAPNLTATLGAGSETIMWDRGTLTRSLGYLGLEYRMRFDLDGEFFRNISSMGWRFGVRAQVSPGVESTTVAKLCTACEAMEPASPGLDFGVAIYMGLLFGR